MSSSWFATRPSPPTWPEHPVPVGSRAVLVAIARSSAQPDTSTPSSPRHDVTPRA